MANAQAGPSRRGPSPPDPAVGGHWPLGTSVKVLVDPHTRSSEQDKEPILRIVPPAHLTADMTEATHILVDGACPISAEAVWLYKAFGKHLVSFQWAFNSFADGWSANVNNFTIVGVEADGRPASAPAPAPAREVPAREPTPAAVESAQPAEESPAAEEAAAGVVEATEEEEEEVMFIECLVPTKRSRDVSVEFIKERKRSRQPSPVARVKVESDPTNINYMDEKDDTDEIDEIDDDEGEEDIMLSQAIEPSPAPPSTPGSSLFVSASQLSLTGSPSKHGPAASYRALVAREARGRPFGPEPVVADRLWGGEDCLALAESLNLDEVDFEVPDAPGFNAIEPDPRSRVSWSKREIRFFVHLEARRSSASLDRPAEIDEMEACVRMFLCAYPQRAYNNTLAKMSQPREYRFFSVAGQLERARTRPRPLHMPFKERNRPFTTAENQCLADLFFRMPDATNVKIFTAARGLLPDRRGREIETAWGEAFRCWRARPGTE